MEHPRLPLRSAVATDAPQVDDQPRHGDPEVARRPSPARVDKLIDSLLGPTWAAEAARFAPVLGVTDFEVRADETSRGLTESEGARGVAVGNTIHMHPDRVRPGTPEGREVLVHELAHLAQARLPADQDAGRASAESEAADLARAIVGGARVRPVRAIDLSRPAADSHAVPAVSAEPQVRAAVERAQVWIETAFAMLVAYPDRRDEIVADAAIILPELNAAALLIEGATTPMDVVVQIEALSLAVVKISRWIDGRPAHAALFSQFLPVVRQTNRLRKRIGLSLIKDMDTPVMPEGVTEQETKESDDYEAAINGFQGALDDRFFALVEGARQFERLVSLEDPAPAMAGWVAIARDLVVAVIANLAGPAGRMVAGLGEAAGDFMESTVSDWVQASASTLAQDAVGKAANDERCDQAVFVHGLTLTQIALHEHGRDAMIEHVRRGTISLKELVKMTGELKKDGTAALALDGCLAAAHGYAALKAHRSLGTETDLPTGATVARMDDYFGKQDPMSKHIVGDRSGANGVGSLSVRVLASGEFEIESFNVHGLNKKIAVAVLQRAGNRVERIDLPLEIVFRTDPVPRPPASHYLAQMATDELGRIRATTEWRLFDEYLGEMHDHLSTPDKILIALRTCPIPDGVAV